jgi:SnoaL-like domain
VLWLRAAFAGLDYDIHHVTADGNLVTVNSTMHGRHVAPWAVYTGGGAVGTVFPPANQTFVMTRCHWFRIEDGMIIEHWANRGDLGMARQLGWIPRPRPTCSRWPGQSGAPGALDLRCRPHVARRKPVNRRGGVPRGPGGPARVGRVQSAAQRPGSASNARARVPTSQAAYRSWVHPAVPTSIR